MKISNYIMEQEINTATTNDIEIAQLYAEMEVIGSMVETYAKHAVIMEYCSDKSEFETIFTESDLPMNIGQSGPPATPNISTKAKDKWYKAIFKWLIAAIKGIISTLTRVSYTELVKMIRDLPETTKFENVDMSWAIVEEVCVSTETFKDYIKSNETDARKYTNLVADLKDKVTSLEGHVRTMSKAEMHDMLVKLDHCKAVPRARKLLKDLEFDAKKFGSDVFEGTGAVKNTHQQLISAIRETAKCLSKLYSNVATSTLNMANAVVKKTAKSVDEAKKNAEKMKKQDEKKSDKK